MKLTTKIYHILSSRLHKNREGKNANYLAGYRACLVDALKCETEIKKGNVDFNPPFVIENILENDRTTKTFIRSI